MPNGGGVGKARHIGQTGAMRAQLVTQTRLVRASAEDIFDVLADPARHADIDGSGSVRSARSGNPVRLYLGARFGMDMRLGASYRITNEVVEFEESHRIAWRHFNGHVWRYVLTPAAPADGAGWADSDGGDQGATLVTEQWDPTPARHRVALGLLGFPRRNRRGMRATLERLAAAVEP